MKKLSQDEFKATISEPHNIEIGDPVFDFWDYVEAIPESDYEGHYCSEGDVYKVYRMKGNNFEHVLIYSTSPDVFMALVNNLDKKEVVGHCLLDFGKLSAAKK